MHVSAVLEGRGEHPELQLPRLVVLGLPSSTVAASASRTSSARAISTSTGASSAARPRPTCRWAIPSISVSAGTRPWARRRSSSRAASGRGPDHVPGQHRPRHEGRRGDSHREPRADCPPRQRHPQPRGRGERPGRRPGEGHGRRLHRQPVHRGRPDQAGQPVPRHRQHHLAARPSGERLLGPSRDAVESQAARVRGGGRREGGRNPEGDRRGREGRQPAAGRPSARREVPRREDACGSGRGKRSARRRRHAQRHLLGVGGRRAGAGHLPRRAERRDAPGDERLGRQAGRRHRARRFQGSRRGFRRATQRLGGGDWPDGGGWRQRRASGATRFRAQRMQGWRQGGRWAGRRGRPRS